MDAKGTSKNTCFLCEKLIQTKTHDFTRTRLYDRVKLFSVQLKIGDFHKDFYIKKIEKLAYHHRYYKILGKQHVDDVRHKLFESNIVAVKEVLINSSHTKQLLLDFLFASK